MLPILVTILERYSVTQYSPYPSHLTMVWCTCPTRCKGGREVAERTRSRHKKEIRDKEHQELLQGAFPERFTSLLDAPQRRRRRQNDDDAQEGRSKKARRSKVREGKIGTQSVRSLMNFAQPRLMSRKSSLFVTVKKTPWTW